MKKLLALMLAALMLLSFAACDGGNGDEEEEELTYEAAAENYEKLMNGKTDYLEKLAPQKYWDFLEEEENIDLDDVIDDFEEMYEDRLDYWEEEYGKNIKITVKITDAEKMDSDDLKEVAEALADRYDFLKKSDVKQAYEVDLKMTVKGADDKEEDEEEAVIVEIDGGWYLINYFEYEDEYGDTVGRASFVADSFV